MTQAPQRADYKDTTPNNFPDDYDYDAVDPKIKLRTTRVREAMSGADVRGALAQSVEIAGIVAGEAQDVATSASTKSIETQNRFNEQIAGTTKANEVIDARLGFSVLRDVLKAKIYHFQNIKEMVATSGLVVGDLVQTESSVVATDSGGAIYRITDVADEFGLKIKDDLFASPLITNRFVNVNAMPNVSDADKLTTAIKVVAAMDDPSNILVASTATLSIDKAVELDCRAKAFELSLRYTPVGGIGSAIMLKNAIGLKGKIDVIKGGSDAESDNALEINTLHHCKLEIFGSYYKGTLLRVTGNDANLTRCIGMQITLRNYNCNRTLYHGDEALPAAGFGTYTDVWEENWDASKPLGNRIVGVYDVSCPHWESHFIGDGEINLKLLGVSSCNFGYLALGGKCAQLLDIGYGSDVSINSLHLGSENGTTAGLNVGNSAQIFVHYFKAAKLTMALSYVTGALVSIDTLNPFNTVEKLIVRDGKNLGYSEKIIAFTNIVKTFVNETKEYQVYKESFINLPIVEGGTNPSGAPYPWYYQSGIIPKFSTSTLDNIDDDNALSLTLDSAVAAGSTKLIYINFPLAVTEQPIFNLDFKAINLASDSKIQIICQFLDANNSLIRKDVLRTIDGSQLSYQQFNFADLNLVPEATPSGVSYFKFGFEFTQGSNNNAKIVISKFAIRKALAH